MKRIALICAAVFGLTLSGCNEEKDEFIGTWYGLGSFSKIEDAGSGKYLISYESRDCGYQWCRPVVLEAERQNDKIVVSGAFGLKEFWTLDPELKTIQRPNEWDMLRVPNDWDRKMAEGFFPNREQFEFFRDNPAAWQQRLQELSGS